MNKLTSTFNEFTYDRTNFWISTLFIILESIIPGLLVWLLLADDFSFSYYDQLPNPHGGYLTLVCVSYLAYTILTSILFYKLKWHKADNFTYSISTTFVFISVILNSLWLNDKSWEIVVRFVIAFVTLVLFGVVGVFFTAFFRNKELKDKEYIEQVLEASKNGQPVPSKDLLKAQKHAEYLRKQQAKKEDLEKFKLEIDKKIAEEIRSKDSKELDKKQKLNEKMDAKEAKLRAKEDKKRKDGIKF